MPAAMTQTELYQLEELIDRHTLSGVLEALAHISAEKAEHLRVNWQDEGAARQWDKAASRIDKLCSTISL